MSLNYHELTMTEPADSPQKRMQFGVICTIMGAVIGYGLLTSGALVGVNPEKGTFPGGHFVYKFTNRDYAASTGLGRSISQELINMQLELGQTTSRHYELEEDIYHIYLDDPSTSGGMRQRFMSGFLVAKGGDDKIKMLMGSNDDTKRTEFTKDEYHDLSTKEIFGMLPYEKAHLPSVDALVLQFPYTGGIASMLVQTIKVIPRMRAIVAEQGEKGNEAIIITTCSRSEQMCTHYAPTGDGKRFLLGRPDTASYNAELGPEELLNWHGMRKTLSEGREKVGSYLMFWKKSKDEEEDKAEL